LPLKREMVFCQAPFTVVSGTGGHLHPIRRKLQEIGTDLWDSARFTGPRNSGSRSPVELRSLLCRLSFEEAADRCFVPPRSLIRGRLTRGRAESPVGEVRLATRCILFVDAMKKKSM